MSRAQYGLGYYRGMEEGRKKKALDPYRLSHLQKNLEEKSTPELLNLLEVYALKMSDGHYSLLRFTTNWRCGLHTVRDENGKMSHRGMGPNTWDGIELMPKGSTMKEAIINCIIDAEQRCSAY